MNFALRISLVFAVSVVTGHAALFDLDADPTRKLRLNVPDGTAEVRGILIVGNGAGGDVRGQATNGELVAFAKSIGFAVLATGKWGNFSASDDYEIDLLEDSLATLAATSARPELIDAPWLPMGHSNGGQMSYGLNAKRPEKVIAFITSKGCCYNDFTPPLEALRTPGMLIAGDRDTTFRRDNIRSLFELNRPRGALWAWVEEEDSGHSEKDSQQLKLTFLAECYRLRYPADQSPVDGPVQLKPLNEWEGWLVDQRTWDTGYTSIGAYDQYAGDPREIGWVPNERIAVVYRAFSSRLRLAAGAQLLGGNPVTAPRTQTFVVDLAEEAWTSIEFFDGLTSLGTQFPTVGNQPSLAITFETGGLHVVHATVTRPDGTLSPTLLRRVMVEGPAATSDYEHWAAGLVDPSQRSRDAMPFADGVPNFLRFAFGLPLAPPDLPSAEVVSQVAGGSALPSFRYRPSATARAAGVSFTPEVSSDLVTWRRADPSVHAIDVSVDGISVTVPGGPETFVRVRASEPLPAVLP